MAYVTRIAMNRLIRTAPLIAAALVGLLSAGCDTTEPAPTGYERVTINGEAFELELAADEKSREQGLKGRTSIDPAGGMLFVFPDQKKRSFWMHDCLTPIDIIFIDPTGHVTATHEMQVNLRREGESDAAYQRRIQAESSYSSKFAAQFVIELAGGTLDGLGVEDGQKIPLDLDRLKAAAR